jgi:hypothetical protein
MRTREPGHVLDHAERAKVRALGHLPGALRHLASRLLRCRDDEHRGSGEERGQRDRDIARPGREVGEEEIELSPVDVAQELLDGLVQHWPPPDHGGLLGHEESHRDDLHAVGLERQDHVVEPDRLAGDADHPGNGEAPDVGVEDAHAVSLGSQGARQVHRDAGFAHATLAGRYGDDRRVGSDEELALLLRSGRPASSKFRDELRSLLLAHRGQLHVDAFDAEGSKGVGHVRRDPVLQRTALDRDQDVDPHRAVVHLDALQHADVLDRLADLGVEHVPQCLADLILGDQRGLLRIILIRTVRTVQITMVRRSVGSVDAGG